MRSLIFLLTLLTAFQPAAWATGGIVSGAPGKVQQASSTSDRLDSAPAATVTPSFGHYSCLNMASTDDNQDAADCQMMCFSSCSTALITDSPFSDHTAHLALITYRGSSAYSFLSLSGPPETQPPQVI